uniref:TRAF-type domain-containing protein n=2 Tax=Clytia hemisphaerica TaxID=252671 RepID=A0A7M5UZ49_9CNID
EHLKNCGYESVACQLECGEFVLRKNIQNHIDTVCPCVSPCEYQDFGCTFKGTKESLQNHMAKNVTTHISLEMKLELQKVKDEFNKQLRAKDQVMVRVKKELDKMKSTNEELIEDLQAKGKQIGFLTEKLKIIDEIENETKRNKDDIETNKEKFNKDLATTKKELARIDKQIATKSPDCNLLEEIGAKANIDNLESLVTHEKFKSLERQLAQQDKLTLEILLTPKCPFLWFIDNFKEIFNITLGRKGTLYSPPLFTEKGYHGRLKVYIKDSPQGKADQISVYFDNLKGPYDEMLEWPMPFTSLNFTLFINGKEVSKASSKSVERYKTWTEHFTRPINIEGRALGRPAFHKTLIENLTDKDIVAIKFHTE